MPTPPTIKPRKRKIDTPTQEPDRIPDGTARVTMPDGTAIAGTPDTVNHGIRAWRASQPARPKDTPMPGQPANPEQLAMPQVKRQDAGPASATPPPVAQPRPYAPALEQERQAKLRDAGLKRTPILTHAQTTAMELEKIRGNNAVNAIETQGRVAIPIEEARGKQAVKLQREKNVGITADANARTAQSQATENARRYAEDTRANTARDVAKTVAQSKTDELEAKREIASASNATQHRIATDNAENQRQLKQMDGDTARDVAKINADATARKPSGGDTPQRQGVKLQMKSRQISKLVGDTLGKRTLSENRTFGGEKFTPEKLSAKLGIPIESAEALKTYMPNANAAQLTDIVNRIKTLGEDGVTAIVNASIPPQFRESEADTDFILQCLSEGATMVEAIQLLKEFNNNGGK